MAVADVVDPDKGKGNGDNGKEDPGPGLRMTLGRDLVALGFLVVFGCFALAVAFFRSAADVTAVIAPIVTMVGTLVGTVFGVQVATQSAGGSLSSGGGGTPISGGGTPTGGGQPAPVTHESLQRELLTDEAGDF